jgi:hypothetical protein
MEVLMGLAEISLLFNLFQGWKTANYRLQIKLIYLPVVYGCVCVGTPKFGPQSLKIKHCLTLFRQKPLSTMVTFH